MVRDPLELSKQTVGELCFLGREWLEVGPEEREVVSGRMQRSDAQSPNEQTLLEKGESLESKTSRPSASERRDPSLSSTSTAGNSVKTQGDLATQQQLLAGSLAVAWSRGR
jgi:hypothetical protein